jgi:hypothetical protein
MDESQNPELVERDELHAVVVEGNIHLARRQPGDDGGR